ncbi:hypothetical protein [Azospirillum sp. sgz302134]
MSIRDPREPPPAALGCLSLFGLSASWQVPFLMPTGWDDLSHIVGDVRSEFVPGEMCLFSGTLHAEPRLTRDGRGAKLVGELRDAHRRTVPFTALRSCEWLREQLCNRVGGEVVLHGRVVALDRELGLFDVEMPEDAWLGSLRPRYPFAPGVVAEHAVRTRMVDLLSMAIPASVAWVNSELRWACGDQLRFIDRESMVDVLWNAHLPAEAGQGAAAQAVVEDMLVAWEAAVRAGHLPKPPEPRPDVDAALRRRYATLGGRDERDERRRGRWMFARIVSASPRLSVVGA